jgi:chitobiase/beta-hexosaminidase-like protein
MTQKMIRLGSVLLVAVLLAALAPASRAQALLPCSVTAIDARTGVVSAKVNASGAPFQFMVTNAKLLAVLRLGQGVYANFTTGQVSLDGKVMCCKIISPPQAAQPGGKVLTNPRNLTVPLRTGPGSTPPASAAQTPTFTPAAGQYTGGQIGSGVTIADATNNAVIYYTRDGSTPTTSSTRYSGPIPVSSTTTIKAMATASGMTNSAIATATYTILSTPPPTVQAAIDLLTGSRDAVLSANCGGSSSFNCPNGVPQTSTIRITRSAVAVSQNPPGSYSFSATLSAASLTDIPVTVSGQSCTLRINTTSSSPAIVTGTLTFTSQSPGGPLNQLSLTGFQISGITGADFSVSGGGFCGLQPWQQAVPVLLNSALHDRMGNSVCIVQGPALVGPCPH